MSKLRIIAVIVAAVLVAAATIAAVLLARSPVTATDGSAALTASAGPGIPGNWKLTYSAGPAKLAGWEPSPWLLNNSGIQTACYSPADVHLGMWLNLDVRDVPCDGVPYSGAWLQSGFRQAYGVFEARIWLPASDKGSIANWPAFWLVGPDWPRTGEIDIMEGLLGRDCQTYHYGPDGVPESKSASPRCTSARPGRWNTYAVDWQPDRITWYLNGRASGTLKIRTTTAPMMIVLDNTTWEAADTNKVPAAMKVAWVRAWKAAPVPHVTLDADSYLPDWIMNNSAYPALQAAGYTGAPAQFLECGTVNTQDPAADEAPCEPGQVPGFASARTFSYWLSKDRERGYQYVIFDDEGWPMTPPSENKTLADVNAADCLMVRLAAKHHLRVIETPVTAKKNMLAAEEGAARCGAYAVDLQYQAGETRPFWYRFYVRAAVKALREISPHLVIIAGLGSNPSGFTVQPATIYDAYEATRSLVNGFWFNMAPRPAAASPCGAPSTAGNTQAAGCPYTATAFFALIG